MRGCPRHTVVRPGLAFEPNGWEHEMIMDRRRASQPHLSGPPGPPSRESPSSITRSSGLAPHFANDDVFIAVWKCVLVSIWKREHRPAYAVSRRSAGEALAAQAPGPLALFTLVLETGILPDDASREALARVRLAPCFRRVVACAGVAEGPPLHAAALRAVSIDLDQRVPPPFPTRMFGTRADAVLWVVERLAQAGEKSIQGNDLVNAITAATKTA